MRIQVNETRRLTPGVRAGLDVARALAALYVVAHHTIDLAGPLRAIFSFGQEAVLVFFLLSGFVIFANERDRSARPRGYYLRRLRRIYPPMVFAMVVSTVLWGLGLIPVSPSWQSALGTLFALQDIDVLKPGVIVGPYLGNSPLWSLSYEIAFYLLFPFVMILWRRSQLATRIVVPAVCVLAYGSYLLLPNHFSLVLAYFMLWWAGAMAAHLWMSGRLNLRSSLPEVSGLLSLSLVAFVGVFVYGFSGLGFFPFLIARHFLFAIALYFLLLTPVRKWMARSSLGLAGPAATVASISYGIYVIHYPVLVQTGADRTWVFVPALALTVLLAWVADRALPSLLPKAPRS